MKTPVTIKYSEAFKQQVLRDLETGKFESHSAAKRAYGIGGSETIKSWILKYGKEHLLGKVIKVQKPKEINEVKALRTRIKKLESALADAHIKQKFDEAYLALACEVAGIENIVEFKKTRYKAVNHTVDHGAKEAGISIKQLCAHVDMSRQNYYAARRLRQKRVVDEELIIELVIQERLIQPRLGGRKLLYLLKPELKKAQVQIGRDRFFEILAKNNLLVPPIKSHHPRTTDSRHSLPIFRNIIKGLEITGPNQVWVSDLTYIRTDEGFMFASLITDAYSHKIVGGYISDSLESIGCQQSLKQAISDIPADKNPIHHSDRGCQYCCHAYVKLLDERGLSISMTEKNHCAENAMAERVNGILKQEYGLGGDFLTKAQAKKSFKQAVWLYNNRRPHTVLYNQFPSEVHTEAA